jgi:hypothetical protein
LRKIFLIINLFFALNVFAQHDHGNHETPSDTTKPKKDNETIIKVDGIETTNPLNNRVKVLRSMFSSYSLNLPMNRNGSGTSWLPDNSPMYGLMWHKGNTQFMFHGSAFIRYTSQNIFNNGKRGKADQFDAPNWAMFMMNTHFAPRTLFSFNSMISLDRLTVGGNGYPLLFQSGETWQGKPLVDRQHPHDLFSELSVGLSYAINKDMDIMGYFGYPGEPALGSPAFMHRPSAMYNPDAPLSHHWQDATHITFGVGTFGIRYKTVKLEGSAFTGREPDEHRYNFDKPKFDSYSGRISVNPDKYFAVQLSYGFLKSPEALEPDVNIHRTTASIIQSAYLGRGIINTSFVWGANRKNKHTENSFLLESAYRVNELALYGRYEFIQKDAHELDLHLPDDLTFNIQGLTFGSSYQIFSSSDFQIMLGAQGTVNFINNQLQTYYGSTPFSAQIYLMLTPAFMNHIMLPTVGEEHTNH